jgi:hypothetical protein
MAAPPPVPADDFGRTRVRPARVTDDSETHASAVSWAAIFAGAAAAAALSLILLMLGLGLGMSAVSPWVNEGIGATAFGVSTILWLSFAAIVSSGMGGYLAGRLRTRWTEVHSDEVYFRDTVHGFLAWAVSALATAALLTSAIGSIVGAGVQAGAAVAGGVAGTAGAAVSGLAGSERGEGAEEGPMAYFVDALFRRDAGAPGAADGAPGATGEARSPAADAAEILRIFRNARDAEQLPPEDARYVGQIVAQRTGLSQQEAEQRVSEVFARGQTQMRDARIAAREAADEARKATAYGSLWIFVSLLLGAFSASLAATWGGRRRDL